MFIHKTILSPRPIMGGVDKLKANLKEQAKDGVIDFAEMETSLKVAGRVDLDTMTDVMLELIRKGTKLTPRARTLAFEHTGIKLWGETNESLVKIQATTTSWTNGDSAVGLGDTSELRHNIKCAIAGAEFPSQVAQDIGARLIEARDRLSEREGFGGTIAAEIDRLLVEFHLTPGDQLGLPLSGLGMSSVDMRGPGGTDFAYEHHYMQRHDMVAMLNDLIADGKLEHRDVTAMTSFLERFHEGSRKGAVASFLSSLALSQEVHEWRYAEKDLRALEMALGMLPPEMVERGAAGQPDAREALRDWIQSRRDHKATIEGSTSERHGYGNPDASPVELPIKVIAGEKEKKLLAEGQFLYQFHETTSGQIREIVGGTEPPVDKIAHLVDLALQAQERLIEAMRGVEVRGVFISPTPVALTRVVSLVELDKTDTRESTEKLARGWLFGLISPRYSTSSSTSKEHGTAQQIEFTGTSYSLEPALLTLKNDKLRREAASAYREKIAAPLADINAALSAVVREMVAAERSPESVPPTVLALMQWAATTKFQAVVKGQPEYLPGAGSTAVPVKVIDRFVMPTLLGPNT